MKQQIFTIRCHGQCVEWVDNHLLVIEHNHNYTSTFVLVLFHKTGGGERASCSEAVRTWETREEAREEKRETARTARANEICVGLTTQKYDWLMREALTTKCQQSKPLTSWWWLNHRKAQWSIRGSYLRSWRYCNFADWFLKKPDFSIVLWDKAR